MRRDFFITGTDTGVGKTLVAAALLRRLRQHGLRVAGMKPVAAGLAATDGAQGNEDALLLQAESSERHPYDIINPCLYEPPIAPHLAAAECGRPVDTAAITRALAQLRSASDCVIVEGAGGFLVPMDEQRSMADLPGKLELEVILVVGLRLGCLNHALLSADAIRQRGLTLAAWVGNAIDPAMARRQANLDTLALRLGAPCLGVLSWQNPPTVAMAAQALDCRTILPAA